MIKLYIFDMGGVLARDFEILPDAAALLGLSADALRALISEDMPALMDGSLSGVRFWQRIGQKAGVRVESNPFIDLFHPTIDRETGDLIEGLRKNSRVVCGTNTMAEHYDIHSRRGDYGVFDAVYASHLMRLAKPDPRFFLEIMEREGVRAEETVFTDDLQENIDAARSLGIRSHLFTDARSFAEALDRY